MTYFRRPLADISEYNLVQGTQGTIAKPVAKVGVRPAPPMLRAAARGSLAGIQSQPPGRDVSVFALGDTPATFTCTPPLGIGGPMTMAFPAGASPSLALAQTLCPPPSTATYIDSSIIPGISNTTLAIGGIALVALLMLR